MTADSLQQRRQEFQTHVWNHAEDVFQTSFDLRPPLTPDDLSDLRTLVSLMRAGSTDDAISDVLSEQVTRRPDFLLVVLQLVGLTRSKPITDLKPALAARGVRPPGSIKNFVRRPDVWELAGLYFARRVRSVLSNILSVPEEALPGALEALNQATWPGYIRQERAKRSGGYAEQRIAILLYALDLPFMPHNKLESGLSADATVAGESFDLVIPDVDAPALCIMSMAHAANIGQYGESKAGDAQRAKAALAECYSPAPLLGVFADGVGFDSNRAGLDGLLTYADEFFQFDTLWKAAVTAAAVLRVPLVAVLQDPASHKPFLRRYSRTVTLLPRADESPGWVEAGEGLLRRG